MSNQPSIETANAPVVTEAVPPQTADAAAAFDRRAVKLLGHLPVGRKLARSAVAVITVALLATVAGFLIADVIGALRQTTAVIASASRMLAESVRTPVKDGQLPTIAAILDAQLLVDGTSGAAVYSTDGANLIWRAKASPAGLPAEIAKPAPQGSSFGLGHVDSYEPVMENGKQVATVLVRGDLSIVFSRIQGAVLMSLVVLAVGYFYARRVGRRLFAVVAEPLSALAATAREVSIGRDYGKRTVKVFEDETGTIAETLNDVCGAVQKRDEELQKARADLEASVLTRTSELQRQIEDRKAAEEAVKDSEMRYRNLFESNPMPMFVMHLETLKFVAVNYAAVKHYGYSMEEFLRFSLSSITHGADQITVMRTFRSNAKSFNAGEWKHAKKNGEVIEVQLTAHAIIFGGQVAKIVLANDVTERNLAQRELDELHKKLVAASRQAGQAEVATGVLHNVGNVLNSVNVSATVLEQSVRKTKATGIRKVAELLNEHRANLPALFSADGKGRKLPDYLARLAEQIEAEQTERLSELAQLSGNITHIKEIVAMQQTYAKVAGLMEVRSARALIDEALRMTVGEMDDAGVTIEVECADPAPEVYADSHKVLQILVNLLKNARQALAETPLEDRRITIRATHDGGDRVAISVHDSGCGIPEENLTRIFNHGFTTKANGHGFGLHTAANAATEMNGDLTAASSGPGGGATFTLELPVHIPVAEQAADRCAA